MVHHRKLSKNVLLLGCTSFFTDISSEMIYPLLQAFVRMVLLTHKALLGPVLGIIEGIAESTASLSKVFVGYYSDRIQKRKALTINGYFLSAAGKIILFMAAYGWYFILLSRFLDRIGKGIRTAPRDAIISESSREQQLGRSYGFHRAMDFAGAFVGVLICYLVSRHFLDETTNNLRDLRGFYILFAISILPAIIGVLFIFKIRETKTITTEKQFKPNLDIRSYDRNLKYFFGVQFIFTLGNSSNQFLLLRSMDLGYDLASVILMYMVFNLVTSLFSTFFGSISDRIGRKKILIAGYVLYAAVYMSFGFITPSQKTFLWVFWIIYGIYYAMTEGVEKALVARLGGQGSKATTLGFFHTIVGIGLLPASLIAGILFSIDVRAPFVFGGLMSIVATAMLFLGVKDKDDIAVPNKNN